MHGAHCVGDIAKWWRQWKPMFLGHATGWSKWLIKSNYCVTKSLNWAVKKADLMPPKPVQGAVA
jgi:hypothetical protein